MIEIEIWDSDTVSKNDLIAQSTVALATFLTKTTSTEW